MTILKIKRIFMEKEIWKVYKETYNRRWGTIKWEISNLGKVKKNRELYECGLLGRYKAFPFGYLHKVVAELFVSNPNNYDEVDHINGNPLDNRAINLKWCTHKENMNNPITKRRQSESQKIAQNKEETKKKISESLKGRIFTEKTKRKMSEIRKKYWQNKRNERQTN